MVFIQTFADGVVTMVALPELPFEFAVSHIFYFVGIPTVITMGTRPHLEVRAAPPSLFFVQGSKSPTAIVSPAVVLSKRLGPSVLFRYKLGSV